MPRILHFSDLHIGTENYGRLDVETGLSTRLMDFLRAFDFVVDYALDDQVDLVLFTGDAFKNRDPTPTHQREFARRIRRLSQAGIPTVLLAGNHDLPNTTTRANSIEIYATLEVENVWVAHKPAVHEISTTAGPIQVVAVPWVTRSRILADESTRGMSTDELNRALREKVIMLLDRLAERVNPELPAILAGHLTVEGAVWGSERSVLLGSDVTVPKSVLANPIYDYVALGHVHRHQSLHESPPIVYAGSIERIDFGEAKEQKGFVLVEIGPAETTWAFIQTPTRPLVQIDVDVTEEEDPAQAVSAQVARHDTSDAIVKLVVRCTLEQVGALLDRHLRELLSDAAYVASIQRDVERPRRLRLGDAGTIANMTPRELLEQYFEAKSTDADYAERLLDYAEEIWAEEL